MARAETVDGSAADDGAGAVLELAGGQPRRSSAARRRLLSIAAAAVLVVGGALAAVALPAADPDVVVGGKAVPTSTDENRSDHRPPVGPSFMCARANGEPTDTATDTATAVFDDASEVAAWSVGGGDGAPMVSGTLNGSGGEDLAEIVARSAAFVASVSPDWTCTVHSPTVDVVDPTTRPLRNLGGRWLTTGVSNMCWVPSAIANPDAVWGVDPSLAAALHRIGGLADWKIIVANRGWLQGSGAIDGKPQPPPGSKGPAYGPPPGPDRLWLQYSIDDDLHSDEDDEDTARIEADVAAAVAAAGDAAGVATECTAH